MFSLFKDLKTKVVLWLSLDTRQIETHQLATSSKNLVVNVQFLLATSKSLSSPGNCSRKGKEVVQAKALSHAHSRKIDNIRER